jgi:hypothetical protein
MKLQLQTSAQPSFMVLNFLFSTWLKKTIKHIHIIFLSFHPFSIENPSPTSALLLNLMHESNTMILFYYMLAFVPNLPFLSFM